MSNSESCKPGLLYVQNDCFEGDYAEGQRQGPRPLTMGDFATGQRASSSEVILSDFAEGMRSQDRSPEVGSFASGETGILHHGCSPFYHCQLVA